MKAVKLSAASGIPIERANKLVTAPSRKTTSSIQKASLTLSGVVRDTETSLPVAGASLFADQYDADQNYQEDIGSVTSGPDGSYSFGVSEGWVLLSISEVTGATYASQTHWVEVNENTTFDVPATPAIMVSGEVTDRDTAPVQGAHVVAIDYGSAYHGYTNSMGAYSVAVPKGRQIAMSVEPPPPYVAPANQDGLVFSGDTVIDWSSSLAGSCPEL